MQAQRAGDRQRKKEKKVTLHEQRDTVYLRAIGDGFCCTHSFWYSHGIRGQEHLPLAQAKQLSKRLEFTTRTIYKWHSAIRDRELIPCSLCPGIGNWRP